MADSGSPGSPTSLDLSQPILRLSRNITVRVHRESDCEALSYHGNNMKITRNMRDTFPYPYGQAEARAFIDLCRNVDASWKPTSVPSSEATAVTPQLPTSWVIAKNDQAIGGCGLKFPGDVHRYTVNLGYWLGEEHWNQGIISEVVEAFIKWIWETYPYIIKIEANAYDWNPASLRVLQKTGLVEEGRQKASVYKDGEYCDLLWYGLLRPGFQQGR